MFINNITFNYLNLHYSLYMSFLTFSYTNILGFLSFIVFLSQLSSGISSSIYYNDFFTIASDSIIYIIININNGWFIRILHVIGSSLFILLILLHLIRAIWIIINNNCSILFNFGLNYYELSISLYSGLNYFNPTLLQLYSFINWFSLFYWILFWYYNS